MPPDNQESAPRRRQPSEGEQTTTHQCEAAAKGWLKMMRGSDRDEMLKANPLAYVLASVIADRAKWSDGFNRFGLSIGEAMLGDYREYGMSEREYRTAKQSLEKWGFATFKTTSKGTIGTLTDTRLFDPLNTSSDSQTDRRPTGIRQATDRRPTSNEEGNKGNKGNKEINRNTAKAVLVPDLLNSSEFLKAWDDWLAYRQQLRKPLTPQTQSHQLVFLASMGAPTAVQSVRQSIEKGWQGLFRVRIENSNEHTTNQQNCQSNTRNAAIIGATADEWERTLQAAAARGQITGTAPSGKSSPQ